MTNNKPSNLLSGLGQDDSSITLESTIARVAELRASRTRRRIVATTVSAIAGLALLWWMLAPISSTPAPALVVGPSSSAPSSSAASSTNPSSSVPSAADPSSANPSPEARIEVAPSRDGRSHDIDVQRRRVRKDVRQPIAPDRTPPQYVNIRHDYVLRALDFDKVVYEEITSTIGSNDDVIMIPNHQSKQTCLQVVCEGGEKRTQHCWAPVPAPVMITSPTGRKVMRVEGGIQPSSHLVALGTRLNNDSVLVWYEASPAFIARVRGVENNSDGSETVASVLEQRLTRVDLQRCSPTRLQDGSVRMDVTRCASHERVIGVDLSDLAGHPIPTKAQYSYEGEGKAVILLSSVPAGVAYVSLHAANGSSDTFPVALP